MKTKNTEKANAIFNKVFNGDPNFMTPANRARGMFGGLAWELSSGRGFDRQPIYGVTCLRENDDGTIARESGLSSCFDNEADAIAYIESLDQEAK